MFPNYFSDVDPSFTFDPVEIFFEMPMEAQAELHPGFGEIPLSPWQTTPTQYEYSLLAPPHVPLESPMPDVSSTTLGDHGIEEQKGSTPYKGDEVRIEPQQRSAGLENRNTELRHERTPGPYPNACPDIGLIRGAGRGGYRVEIMNCNGKESEEEKKKRKEIEAFIAPYEGLHWLPIVTREDFETL